MRRQQVGKYAYLLIVILNLLPVCSFADDPAFFKSTQGAIPPATLVMSLPTPNASLQDSVWDSIRANLRFQDQYSRPEVSRWIKWLKSNPKILNQVCRNARPYIYYVFQQTQRYQMPAEFALLPVIESGYNPYAFSSSGAVGIWQMMPGTAMIYGLDINWWYDGRRDILTSTDRALNFLVSLRESLGDWLLATAAYDTGAANVQKAAAAHGSPSSSFWDLSLRKETEDYVPKLLAVAAIVSDPQKYGVTLPYIPNKDYFTAVKLNFQLDASEIARLAEVSLFEIQQLNPGMRRWATSPEQQYTLLLPVEKADVFRSHLAQVAGQNHVTWQYHEVHEGQTLGSIAANYHTNTELLRKVNDLESDEVTSGQGLVVPLYLHRKYQLAQNEAQTAGSPETSNADTLTSPEAIEKITADDILSGHLDTANLQQNTPPLNSESQTMPPINNGQMASLANGSNSVQPNVQENSQQVQSAEPIHEQDDLRTILNKLYTTN